MSRHRADDAIVSGRSDVRDLPLDGEVAIGHVEYARIMGQIRIADGEPGTTVSAFNSSV